MSQVWKSIDHGRDVEIIDAYRKRWFLVPPFAGGVMLLSAPPALGANTDIYPDFAFARLIL